MKRGWWIALWAYLAGMGISESIFLWLYGIGEIGALQRHHSARDWLIAAVVYLAASAIWPYWVAVLLLAYFGLLPK
jgi:hypothetical protein